MSKPAQACQPMEHIPSRAALRTLPLHASKQHISANAHRCDSAGFAVRVTKALGTQLLSSKNNNISGD